MKRIRLLAIGDVETGRLQLLSRGIERETGAPCSILPGRLDPAPLYHPERQQYHSTEMLEVLCRSGQAGDGVLLGITPVDLYIPILTFVFGEAQLRGSCAVASYHRLRQEFYGLPPDDTLVDDRLLKEAVHELGHTFGLLHCDDYSCAMASSHSAEWIDLKGTGFCNVCRVASGLKVRSQSA